MSIIINKYILINHITFLKMYLLEEDQEGSMTLNMTWHLDEDWLILGFVFSTKPGQAFCYIVHCMKQQTRLLIPTYLFPFNDIIMEGNGGQSSTRHCMSQN